MLRALTLSAGLLAVLMLAAPPGGAQVPEADRLRAFFAYPAGPVPVQVRSLGVSEGVREQEVTFPSPLPSEFPENNTVYGWLYLPVPARDVPAVIVLHSLGSKYGEMERRLCRVLAFRGMAAMLVALPYHMERSPQGYRSGKGLITGNPEEVLQHFRQAVMDVRRAADWLSTRPEIDSERLGLAGISLGAVVGAMVMGVDRRFSAFVSMDGGGDVALIYWESPLLFREKRAAREAGWTLPEVARVFRPIEPTVYAPEVPRRQVLMINGLNDLIMPHRATEDLWRAFGRPHIVWMAGGHYGIFLAEKRIYAYAADFLERRLTGRSPAQPAPAPQVPVRLRPGVFVVEEVGPSLGLSVDMGFLGRRAQGSLSLLVNSSRPLLALTWSPRRFVIVGYGIPVLRTAEPRLFVGVEVTL